MGEQRRVQTETSRTAEWVCVARACSYRERDPHRHSDDWVAAAILPPFLRAGARVAPFRRLWARLAPKGMYLWVVARTRYIDEVFARVGPSMAQVLIMGAGYDSRAFRFRVGLRNARVFELDAPKPQADKRRGLELRKLDVPENLAFVPVDFEIESASQRLAQAGFLGGKPTLYLLEGLTMYLEPATLDETFRLIGSSAGPGSVLVFDYAYASIIEGERNPYGASGLAESVAKAGEAWRFGIEKGGVGEFLARYGFEATDEASPETLELRYFTDPSGRLVGRVNGTQALVTARKTDVRS
ncbi:MAG TPA: SAM-dependent methyltransferase [Candidatus Limnocylindrales bacterium]|nr:SAM-dependent methyltransferase [Candidatus Limnocylindrales bacterium]